MDEASSVMDWNYLFWFLVLVVSLLGIGAYFANPAQLIARALRSDDEHDNVGRRGR